MARPHDHLMLAANAHARLTAGEAHPSEADEAAETVTEPTASQRSARAQKRGRGGKFA
jgi:hypothetical protein